MSLESDWTFVFPSPTLSIPPSWCLNAPKRLRARSGGAGGRRPCPSAGRKAIAQNAASDCGVTGTGPVNSTGRRGSARRTSRWIRSTRAPRISSSPRWSATVPTARRSWPTPAATTPPCGRKSNRCYGFTRSTRPAFPTPAPRRPRPAHASRPGSSSRMRYRMVTRLGRGGMGDVWRADDLMLETPVALKLIRSTSQAGRERLLQEVRLARRVTHPAVVRVFDVGEADDEVFFSMELVEGQDLASVLRHAGRLAPARVVEIARQLCGGLQAAHAEGVLHRDLKPANVLVDQQGRVRITDFGIAVPTGAPGSRTHRRHAALHGARAAPRRRDAHAADRPLRPRRHALRAAHRPAPRAAAAPATARWCRRRCWRPGIDPRSRTSSCARCRRLPGGRPASAAAFAAALPGEPEVHALRGVIATAASAVVLDAHLVGGHCRRRRAARRARARSSRPARARAALTSSDTIVLADFVNTTSEPLFDGALKVALAVALEQSPFLKVFPDDRVQETLRLMERPPDTRDHARGGARDRGARAASRRPSPGSIASLGRNYVLALEAINAQNGDVMAREQVEAGSKEEVLTALGTAVASLRERLGESLAVGCASSTCRCRGPRRRRSRRCTPTRWRSTRAATRRSTVERDPASAARHRARPRLRAGAGGALRRLRQHQPDRAGARLLQARVRPARPRQRARALHDLVALLPRRDAGLGQGARPGARVDGRLPARGVCLQRARPGRGVPRPARRSRGGAAQGDRARSDASCRPRATWATTCCGRTSSQRPRRTSRQSIAAGVEYQALYRVRLSRLAAARTTRRAWRRIWPRARKTARRARRRQLGRARGGLLRPARGGARRRQRRAPAGAAAQFQGVGRALHHRGRRDPRHRRALRRGPALGARGARVEPRHRHARHQRPRPRLVRRRPGAGADARAGAALPQRQPAPARLGARSTRPPTWCARATCRGTRPARSREAVRGRDDGQAVAGVPARTHLHRAQGPGAGRGRIPARHRPPLGVGRLAALPDGAARAGARRGGRGRHRGRRAGLPAAVHGVARRRQDLEPLVEARREAARLH